MILEIAEDQRKAQVRQTIAAWQVVLMKLSISVTDIYITWQAYYMNSRILFRQMFKIIPLDMMKHTLLLVSSFAIAYAADTSSGSVFGSSNDTALMNANQHSNISKSVPFQMGSQNFTFRVNVAEFTPDWNTTVQNPRVATSFYAIEWSGDTSLNDTMAAVESLSKDQYPRICATLPLDLLSASTTNGYNDKDDGDCTGALGKDCVNDLKQTSYDLGVSCSPTIPKSCGSKLDTGGIGSAREYFLPIFAITPVTYFHDSIDRSRRDTNVSIRLLPLVIASVHCWRRCSIHTGI
jgi:hypothetical protein